MENGGLGLILGGQKSSKMMTFSKHEKHEKSMAGASLLRLRGDQKSIKVESEKNKKNKKIEHPKKQRNGGAQGVITILG